MSTKYSLNVKHNGTDFGDFCIYQTDDKQDEDIRSLVWFKKTAHPGTQLHFEWGVDYSFVWSEEGSLVPGVIFKASEVMAADPANKDKNTIKFSKENGAYHFIPSDNPTNSGKLGIVCADNIPANSASIGIGMSGKSAFARVAHPSLKHTFSPHPKYWIAFGKFEEGEVIDLNRMTEKYEIKFPVNQYERNIELCANNTWGDMD